MGGVQEVNEQVIYFHSERVARQARQVRQKIMPEQITVFEYIENREISTTPKGGGVLAWFAGAEKFS